MGCEAVSILGVGDCTLDHIFRVVQSPKHGESAQVADYERQGGGLTATALMACNRLGSRTRLVCRLGRDEAGDQILAELIVAGVDVSGIERQAEVHTPVSFIQVDGRSGERTIFWYRPTPRDTHAGIPADWNLSGIDCVLVDDRWPEAAVSVSAAARRAGVTVVADLEPSDDNRELAGFADVLIAPATWGRKFAIGEDFSPALREIHRLGPRIAVVTIGKKGCWHSDGLRVGRREAFDVPVVDTTGAGDAFHGGFAFAMARKWPVERCVDFASAVAALKCRSMGGRAGLPTLDEALELLERSSCEAPVLRSDPVAG